jgi:hypothetical protein
MLVEQPPMYDSPTTRGLFDTTTTAYWASDCYSTPVKTGTAFVDQLPRGRKESTRSSTCSARGSPSLMAIGSPASADALNGSNPATATAHRPTITTADTPRAFELLQGVPTTPPVPQPDHAVLDQIVAMKPRDPLTRRLDDAPPPPELARRSPTSNRPRWPGGHFI